ncbi:MAG TPA: chemotaxis-specific protein-glutamate methyltransferase CheB [Rhizomicrobium sp.]|nr:chemotaxis-specific protein-glutamate methyltransferase CheB [Rhizomicrobium sp.]
MMRAAKIRVLVVDDSPTVRASLCGILASEPDIEVVGDAEDGARGIELCEQLRPDVITLDMAMPRVDGLAVTEHVMAHCPRPILIVSASHERGEAFSTFDALKAGAVDVLEKATGNEPEGEWERQFIATVKLVARIKVITRPRARPKACGPSPMIAGLAKTAVSRYSAVAIGASTGGPSAVVQVLRALPPQFPIPVLLVLHIGAGFAPAFAEWLSGQTPHKITFPRGGERLTELGGGVIMAPADRHVVVHDGMLFFSDEAERHSCRPSVDVLFESVAASCGASAVGCLLTGMGRDGAAGLRLIRQAGGRTIVQDEATSVVYGMPREAVLLGAAERVLPLNEIGPALASLAEVG